MSHWISPVRRVGRRFRDGGLRGLESFERFGVSGGSLVVHRLCRQVGISEFCRSLKTRGGILEGAGPVPGDALVVGRTSKSRIETLDLGPRLRRGGPLLRSHGRLGASDRSANLGGGPARRG